MGRYIDETVVVDGATTLNELVDVEVVAPLNDDLLVYDDITSEWNNSSDFDAGTF